jgi:hypothetical protein
MKTPNPNAEKHCPDSIDEKKVRKQKTLITPYVASQLGPSRPYFNYKKRHILLDLFPNGSRLSLHPLH